MISKLNTGNVVVSLGVVIILTVSVFTRDATAAENGKIVFESAEDGTRIYTINPDGTSRTRVSETGTFPAFSPDGKKIAFYGERGIVIINADGSNQTDFPIPNHEFGSLSWSPDGRKIAFAWGGICAINTDGTSLLRITDDPADVSPSWSPDGTRIAFTKGDINFNFFKTEIYVMNADGSNQTQLTNNSLPDYGVDWSPDGKKLAFTRYDFCFDIGNGEIICLGGSIFTINPTDGSNETFLTGGDVFDDSDAYDPSWSPDGTKIAFRGYQAAANYSRTEIFVINADGGPRTNITNTADTEEYYADWGAVPAASVSVSGRVTTPDGLNLRNAAVVLTDSRGFRRTATTSSFGNFIFDDVAPGETYVIGVSSKRYRFATRSILLNNSLMGVDFVGFE